MLILCWLVCMGLFLLAGSLSGSDPLRHQGTVLALFATALMVGAAVLDGCRSVVAALRERGTPRP